MIRVKTLFAGAAILTALVATAASAATFIVPLAGGPFSLTNALATFPGTELLAGNTYDFTFSMAQPLNGSTATIQIQAQAQKSGDNEPITYDFYSGDPGSGSFLGTSSTGTNANLTFNPGVSDYYVQVTPAYIAEGKTGEALSGTILISTVPEPAAWALMLVGFGGLGATLRRRATKTVAA
jgi:hypothetical protein